MEDRAAIGGSWQIRVTAPDGTTTVRMFASVGAARRFQVVARREGKRAVLIMALGMAVGMAVEGRQRE